MVSTEHGSDMGIAMVIEPDGSTMDLGEIEIISTHVTSTKISNVWPINILLAKTTKEWVCDCDTAGGMHPNALSLYTTAKEEITLFHTHVRLALSVIPDP